MTKILVVDDDEQSLAVLRALLENQGYDVVTARHGAEAIQKARKEPPDLIVSDILMPVMDGFTLCLQWKRDRQLQQIPFIFYTATYTDPRDKGVALRLGVERFIVKPLEPHLFLEVLEEVIAECRAPGYRPRETLEAREETAYFREYNDALVRRLETKVVELEGAYDAIEREMADRKKAEEALRESEKRLAEIFNFLPDATFAIDQKGTIIAWNRTMEEMTGVLAGDMLGRGNYEYALPFYGVRQPILIDLVFGVDEEIQKQHRFVKKEGDILLMEADMPVRGKMRVLSGKARPLYDSRGTVTGAIESIRDITERIDAEEALLASEQRYKQLLDSVTDYIFTTQISNGQAMATFHGQGCAAVTGYTTDEYEGNPFLWYDMVHPEDRQIVINHASIAIKGGSTIPLEHRILHKNGSIRWVRNTMVPRYDHQGQLVACDGLVSDITERKQAEEALKASEEKYRQIFENASEGIFQSTPDGRYLSANPALARMFGYDSPGDLIKSVANIGREVFMSAEEHESLQNMLGKGMPVDTYEVELRRMDGSTVWGSMAARAVFDPDGEVLYYEGTVVDITERKRLETQLLQSQRMEAIVQLAGRVAHDFNNFLSIIMGFSGMLRMKMDEDDPRLYYVNQISSASERAAGVTQNLLAFSKKQVIELKPRNVNRILRDMERLLRHFFMRQTEVVFDLPQTDITIFADVALMDQVLLNLAARARETMPEGGRFVVKAERIQPDTEFLRSHGFMESRPYAVISVTDTGPGMDEATRERIFEPFSTGPERGLALSTVYGIIKQHNGHVEVTSHPERGTVFLIYLPALETAAGEDRHWRAADSREAMSGASQATVPAVPDDNRGDEKQAECEFKRAAGKETLYEGGGQA